MIQAPGVVPLQIRYMTTAADDDDVHNEKCGDNDEIRSDVKEHNIQNMYAY